MATPTLSVSGDPSTDAELARFEAGSHDAASFDHAEHVRIAFEMLGRYEFDEALFRFATGLRRMTLRLGMPGKYHATITTACLALVAERRLRCGAGTWAAFVPHAGDLLDRRCLAPWYSDARLADATARATFVLPDAADRSGARGAV